MKGNDCYYLNDPNYYKSLNFAGINNHLKSFINSRKSVLSDIYHHRIKKTGRLTVVQPTSWFWIYQRKQSFFCLTCLFPLRLTKKIQEPEKRPCLAIERNGFLKACYDNRLDKFFVTAIPEIPFQQHVHKIYNLFSSTRQY